MIVQKMRLERGWSQQQLADIAGINVRTVQRIESGQSVSLDSLKALGAAFDVDFARLQETTMRQTAPTPAETELALALSQVRQIRRFWHSALAYLVIMSFLVAVNLATSPYHLWVIWPALGWGLALVLRAARVFNLLPWFGPEWERREVEKRLGRNM